MKNVTVMCDGDGGVGGGGRDGGDGGGGGGGGSQYLLLESGEWSGP